LVAKAYDNAGNITQSPSVAVTVNNYVPDLTAPRPDLTAPTVSSFSLPATAASLTVAVSALTANDNIGVTGYLITESATAPATSASGWTAAAPTSFTFSSAGAKTAYAWTKDAAGNVSASRSATVNIALPDSTTFTNADALLALQIGSGKVTPTLAQTTRLDVSPVIDGKSAPDGNINSGDVIAILSKVVGKAVF